MNTEPPLFSLFHGDEVKREEEYILYCIVYNQYCNGTGMIRLNEARN